MPDPLVLFDTPEERSIMLHTEMVFGWLLDIDHPIDSALYFRQWEVARNAYTHRLFSVCPDHVFWKPVYTIYKEAQAVGLIKQFEEQN